MDRDQLVTALREVAEKVDGETRWNYDTIQTTALSVVSNALLDLAATLEADQ